MELLVQNVKEFKTIKIYENEDKFAHKKVFWCGAANITVLAKLKNFEN
jgi:hypothetical protein